MRRLSTLASLGLIIGAAACNEDASSVVQKALSLNIALSDPATPGALSALVGTPTPDGLVLNDGTNELVIASAEVVMNSIKFESADGSAGCGSSSTATQSQSALEEEDSAEANSADEASVESEDDKEDGGDDGKDVEDDAEDDAKGDAEENRECPDFRLDAFIVNLPVDGSVSQQISADVPVGSYKQIKFKIHALGGEDSDAALITNRPELDRLSVLVKGTINGEAFTFSSRIEAEQELEFNPPMEIVEGSTEAGVTLAVDVSTWFSSDGLIVDPRVADDSSAKEGIDRRVQASFRGFEDDDHDGKPHNEDSDEHEDENKSEAGGEN